MVRRAGEPGFRVIGWDEALDIAASHLRAIDPARAAFYLTSRGITNESYYVAQKAARVYGSPHVDNSARLCHAASTVAMKSALGHGASTCSYADWIGADLIVFFGSNTPNNQPVTDEVPVLRPPARAREVAVVNPLREPGLERYWIPSVAESALFGTKLADHWFAVHTGGDLAFLVGTLKALLEADADRPHVPRGAHDRLRGGRRCGARRVVDGHPGRERRIARRHRALRPVARRSAQRDLRVVDGAHAARARRGHHPRAAERGASRVVSSAARIAG